jgi:hypothetical protein
MTCRHFEAIWSERLSDALPAEAASHLATCDACAAMVRADAAVDSRLRRLAAESAPDVEAARAGIMAAIHLPAFLPSPVWRRPPVRVAAGLAAAAVLAVLAAPQLERLGARQNAVAARSGGSAMPPVQILRPGSRVVDDLLLLNPVQVAGADDQSLGPALAALAQADPDTDERLRKKVTVHASWEKISDVLAGLSRATGVRLVPRLEVADEIVTIWATDRPLIDVMRDLRLLRGFYWSRDRRGDQYVYSLWQDAQGRAQEEAELQRHVNEQQRWFEESVLQHVKALNADDTELKRLAQQDPYLVLQMKHPVIRGAYQLFAALSLDQQTGLLRGQTPGRAWGWGHLFDLVPKAYRQGDMYLEPEKVIARWKPTGDIVTLRGRELSAVQRTALATMLQGAKREVAREQVRDHPEIKAFQQHRQEVLQGADLETATVYVCRQGEPGGSGLTLRVDFKGGGREWVLNSNFALPKGPQDFYGDMLRKGEFKLWEEGQKELNRYLGRNEKNPIVAAPKRRETAAKEPADTVLDAPVSIAWPLVLREPEHPMLILRTEEILAFLERDLGRPVVATYSPQNIRRSPEGDKVFRMEKRPVREVLREFFPNAELRVANGAVLIKDPSRLMYRANEIPRAVDAFLEAKTGATYTLDDMAMLARALTPWQVTRLAPGVPAGGIDSLLETQELLKLYGDLAPTQRQAVAKGLPFASMTPQQQALFLAFAQRYRPYVEPWRFQAGGLRLTSAPPPKDHVEPFDAPGPVARKMFHVRFQEGDAQTFPVDLFPSTRRQYSTSLKSLVGKPFPFPPPSRYGDAALCDHRLRKKALALQLAWPVAEPYLGTAPPRSSMETARVLAERLRGAGVTVAEVTLGGEEVASTRWDRTHLPNWIRLWEPGSSDGQPHNWTWTPHSMRQSPTVILLDRDEVVRAVFEGAAAWDTAAIEKAARSLASRGGGGPVAKRAVRAPK